MHIVFKVIIIFSIIVIIYMLFTESYPKNKYVKFVNRQEGGNKINKANNILCTKIFNELNNELNNDSVFSPMSITFALSLLHQGAEGNTDTELTNLFNNKYTLNELNQLYKLFNNDIMKMTNALLINKKYKVNDQYLDSIKKLVLIEYDDFGNKKLIVNKVNNYIEKNTNNMIKNILQENDIDALTILILINTIYFKAKWLHEFKSNNTEKMQFNNKSKNELLQVDMMYQENYFDYYENDNIQLLEMSYKNKDYAMGIVLPKGNDIPPKLTSDQIDEFINNLKRENVELHLPKFKHRKNIQLVPLLQKLGVNDLFNSSAKLSIAKEAYISKIIHEAVVIVDETGTEAAAVTVAVMTAMMAMPPKKKIIFKADHPFIYYIRYKPNNMLLFYGAFYGK